LASGEIANGRPKIKEANLAMGGEMTDLIKAGKEKMVEKKRMLGC
jgi:hypothetical protein